MLNYFISNLKAIALSHRLAVGAHCPHTQQSPCDNPSASRNPSGQPGHTLHKHMLSEFVSDTWCTHLYLSQWTDIVRILHQSQVV